MMNILEIAQEEAKRAGAKRIASISLQIGQKSGVVVDALEFAFDVVSKGSSAENAKLLIESIPLRGECLTCGYQFDSDTFLLCSRCGGYAKIIAGQELNIQSIEVE